MLRNSSVAYLTSNECRNCYLILNSYLFSNNGDDWRKYTNFCLSKVEEEENLNGKSELKGRKGHDWKTVLINTLGETIHTFMRRHGLGVCSLSRYCIRLRSWLVERNLGEKSVST